MKIFSLLKLWIVFVFCWIGPMALAQDQTFVTSVSGQNCNPSGCVTPQAAALILAPYLPTGGTGDFYGVVNGADVTWSSNGSDQISFGITSNSPTVNYIVSNSGAAFLGNTQTFTGQNTYTGKVFNLNTTFVMPKDTNTSWGFDFVATNGVGVLSTNHLRKVGPVLTLQNDIGATNQVATINQINGTGTNIAYVDFPLSAGGQGNDATAALGGPPFATVSNACAALTAAGIVNPVVQFVSPGTYSNAVANGTLHYSIVWPPNCVVIGIPNNTTLTFTTASTTARKLCQGVNPTFYGMTLDAGLLSAGTISATPVDAIGSCHAYFSRAIGTIDTWLITTANADSVFIGCDSIGYDDQYWISTAAANTTGTLWISSCTSEIPIGSSTARTGTGTGSYGVQINGLTIQYNDYVTSSGTGPIVSSASFTNAAYNVHVVSTNSVPSAFVETGSGPLLVSGYSYFGPGATPTNFGNVVMLDYTNIPGITVTTSGSLTVNGGSSTIVSNGGTLAIVNTAASVKQGPQTYVDISSFATNTSSYFTNSYGNGSLWIIPSAFGLYTLACSNSPLGLSTISVGGSLSASTQPFVVPSGSNEMYSIGQPNGNIISKVWFSHQ
jgi:hypothetical protein